MASEPESRGEAVLHQLFDKATVKRAFDAHAEWDTGFAALIKDVCFGTVWARPGLPIKTRSMITIAAMIAVGRSEELKAHFLGALNLGITADELKEIVIHLSQYCGIPAAVQAERCLRQVTT
jgi:4-carboxymuconolactone decarboxylase